MPRRGPHRLFLTPVLCLAALVLAHAGAEETPAVEPEAAEPRGRKSELDITELSLEDLSQIEVTSVSRSEGQKLFDAPAAVSVITQEDIRRTGHVQLPEILRLVPGMHVARLDANKWAISARGMNDRFNSRQLVQMDGRSIYTPIFGGVFWSSQDMVLEDLERVEVIRGPGATLWGANAVNGIINFTSKDAKDTQGLLVSGGGGPTEGGFATVRYGGKINDELHYRVYSKFQEHRPTVGQKPEYTDDWMRWQAGARFDWEAKDGTDHVTWQGDVYGLPRVGSSLSTVSFAPPAIQEEDNDTRFHGYNGLARWTHDFSEGNQMKLQAYYDLVSVKVPHNERNVGSILRLRHETIDLDFQHSFRLGKRQKIVYGANARTVDFESQRGWIARFDPSGRRFNSVGGFFQDTITAIDDTLDFTIGSKIEYNDFTGFEYQPSLKAVYKPHKDHVLWFSVARAVRVPVLTETDLTFFVGVAPPGFPVIARSNLSLDAEVTHAFEAGYRTHPVDWFSLDIAAYHNRNRNLVDFDRRPTNPLVFLQHNSGWANSSGVEMTATWHYYDFWRVTATYSWMHFEEGSYTEEDGPDHQFHVRSYWDINERLEINAALYRVDRVKARNVPEYWRADLGLTWRPIKNLDVSVWGTNLFEDSHFEYPDFNVSSRARSYIPRSFYGKVTWKF